MMIAKIHVIDGWDEENDRVYSMPLDSEQMEQLVSYTPQRLMQFMHDNSVGKIAALGENKFIPCIEIGKLSVSLQINYYVWRDRNDKAYQQHMTDAEEREFQLQLVTEEEFRNVLSSEGGIIDVFITYNDSRLFLGQMRLYEVSKMFREIAVDLDTTIQD